MRNLKKILSLAAISLILATAFTSKAQIYSTLGGGPWDSTWAWIGGIVPNAAHDVVINGPIYSSNNFCNNLTITSTGSLQNNYYSKTLTVNGWIENDGSIHNHGSSGYPFSIRIYGNITNNGTWVNKYTYLEGAGSQQISCENANTFSGFQFLNEKTGGTVQIVNEVNFANVQIHFNDQPCEIMANSLLNIHNGIFQDVIVNGNGPTSQIFGQGTIGSDSFDLVDAELHDLSLSGAIEFGTVACYGTISSDAILQNAYYTRYLSNYGDFINSGTIKNHGSSGYPFYVKNYGNIINNNIWQNSYLEFYGDNHQYISLAAGKVFQVANINSNKDTGDIEALTNLSFLNCNINWGSETLLMQNGGALSIDGGYLKNANVYANEAKSGDFNLTVLNNAYLQNCDLTNISMDGTIKCRNNTFYGNIINNGTIYNESSSYQIDIVGNFTNNGTIRNHPTTGYILNFTTTGNIVNNGTWFNDNIELVGDALQTYQQMNNSIISTVHFIVNKSENHVMALSDVYFQNCSVNLNGDTLVMQDGGMLSHDGGFLYDAVVYANSAKSNNFELFMTNNAYLRDCYLTNPVLTGLVDSRNNTMYGEIIVEGILQNDFNTYTLTIDGNLSNNGTIRNHPLSGYPLNLFISQNITNNGIWTNSYNYLNGTSDQHMTCLNSSAIEGYQFINQNTTGQIFIDDEVNFGNVEIYFNNQDMVIGTNSTLSIANGFLYQANVSGNGISSSVTGVGTNPTEAPYIQDVTIANASLDGIICINSISTLTGSVTNYAELRNQYYNANLDIYGDFINEGILTNWSGSGYYLTCRVYGNITNNNTWNCWAIDWYDTGDQTISSGVSSTFQTTWFTSFKPSGKIIGLSDLRFSNTAVNLNSDTLIVPADSHMEVSGQYLFNAVVMPEETKDGGFELHMNNNAYLENVHLYDPILYGNVDIRTSSFYGAVVNNAVIQNDYYGYSLNIDGNLTNNGQIKNYYGSGYGLAVEITGNLTNNGDFNNSTIRMTGTTDQYISLIGGYNIAAQMGFISDILTSPYQWYLNGYPLFDPPNGSNGFSGEQTSTLIFDNPVSSIHYGVYHCVTGGGNSRNLYVEEGSEGIQLDLTLFLEGPFTGSEMDVALNTNNYIPLNQPYNQAPWNYSGTETVSSIPANAVDWVLIELRDTTQANFAGSDAIVAQKAAFLLNDGSVVDLDGSSMLSFNTTIDWSLFVVVWHRNHLGIMAAYPATVNGSTYSYDFTFAQIQVYGGLSGHKELAPNKWGMIAADGNSDGTVSNPDKNDVWTPQAGQSGYNAGDFNMDGDVGNPDKNELWVPNSGKGSQVPGSAVPEEGYKCQVPK
jgi:hypothetical protein